MSASNSGSSTMDVSSALCDPEFDVEDEELDSSKHADGNQEFNIQDIQHEATEAYADEPLADETWFENYTRATEEERQKVDELRKRMQGEVTLDSW